MISLIPQFEKKDPTAAATGEAGREAEGSDIEKILNKAGFVEFVARFGENAPDQLEPHVASQYFEVFEAKDKVKSELKGIFGAEIGNETAIAFSKEDLKCVDLFIEKQAVEDPGVILKFRDEIRQFKELPAQVAQAEGKIARLAEDGGFNARIMELERQSDVAFSAVKGADFWGKFRMYAGMGLSDGINLARAVIDSRLPNVDVGGAIETYHSQKELAQQGVPITQQGIEERLDFLVNERNAIRDEFSEMQRGKTIDLMEMKGRIMALKESLFSHAEMAQQISATYKTKLNERITKLTGRDGLGGYAEAEKLIAKLSDEHEAGFEYLQTAEVEELKQGLAEQAEFAVRQAITKTLSGMKLGDNAFSKLEDQLRKALETGDATMVGKDRKESFEFVVEAIQQEADQLDDKAKRILCNQLIAKLRSQAAAGPSSAPPIINRP